MPTQTQANAGVSVVGQGIVLAQPDTARITLGVDITQPSLAQAQAEAAQRMDAVIAKLKADGIADSDIRTVSYNVTPQYDQRGDQSQPVLRGYQVQNMVEVKTTNVAGLGALLDDAVGSGATRIFGINFEASDMEALKGQARDQAMSNAQAKAQQLAKDAGVTLGRPIAVDESDTGGVTPLRAPAAAQAAAPTTPIQPGQLQISTTVRVTWSIQ
ncbi:MAG TPA: SIMPL domain-containing protein [Chloroflexota bacterium]